LDSVITKLEKNWGGKHGKFKRAVAEWHVPFAKWFASPNTALIPKTNENKKMSSSLILPSDGSLLLQGQSLPSVRYTVGDRSDKLPSRHFMVMN
jgi:hypothetical protein